MGCADCYDKFEDKLEPSLRKIHGKTKHIGKFVSYSEENEKSEDTGDKKEQASESRYRIFIKNIIITT